MNIYQQAARKWVNVWRGAGFKLHADGDSLKVTGGKLMEVFPDSRQIIEALKPEIICALLTSRDKATERAAYSCYRQNIADDLAERKRLQERLSKV